MKTLSIFDATSTTPALALVWLTVLAALAILLWPRGRGLRLARQTLALAALGFREGIRLKILWTVFALALLPGVLAYCSDADGSHAGRARLILATCIGSGEILGAALVVLMAALSVSREIESRIMHTIGAKPVPRTVILLGKACGFWAISLSFYAALMLFTGVLVRAVPLRAESRAAGLNATGTWEQLQRNALTTRTFIEPASASSGAGVQRAAEFKFIKPGKSQAFTFLAPACENGVCRSLRLTISSTSTYAAHAADVRFTATDRSGRTLLDRTATVPQGTPFELHFDPDKTPQGEITLTIAAANAGANAPSLIVALPSGLKLGTDADGLAGNLFKAFALMALQSWVLALITTGWSGVLSFPVTVALGLILVLGGELSRHVVELLQSELERMQTLGIQSDGAAQLQQQTIESLKTLLSLLPDFQAAGGPAAFVDGKFLPLLAVAHAMLWMGVARAAAWAAPGFWAFQKREVGS